MKIAILIVAAIVGLANVGNMGFQDELLEQIEYCKNVKLGYWQDYNDSFKTDCTNAKLKEIEIKLQ